MAQFKTQKFTFFAPRTVIFKKNTVQEKTWFSTVYFLNGNFY